MHDIHDHVFTFSPATQIALIITNTNKHFEEKIPFETHFEEYVNENNKILHPKLLKLYDSFLAPANSISTSSVFNMAVPKFLNTFKCADGK